MFSILKVRTSYLRIIRLISILWIGLKYYTVEWLSNRRRLRTLITKKYKRGKVIRSQAERIRMMLEELGPTFVKFGQFLAGRPDIVSDKLLEELKKLQSGAKPFDDDRAAKLIEKELGGPISSLLDDYNPKCYASASIGQVYRARLKEGTEVVIKIQRPDIESKVKLDIYLIKVLTKQLVKEYPELKSVDMMGFVDEFGQTLIHEMDYLREAGNARRFEEIFKGVGYCKIPHVYPDLCTKKLLVMEYVSGAIADNIPELIRQEHDPKCVARNGMHIFLKMIVKHGFFHADPHAGNMYVQDNNRIAIIDFGMVGSLKPAHMSFLAKFSEGIANTNASLITDALTELCEKRFFKERDNLEFNINEMLQRHAHHSYENIRFSMILNECLKIMTKFELNLPASIYLLLKSLATIEKVGYKLDKDISLAAMIQPYSEEVIKKSYSPRKIAEEIYQTLYDYGSLIRAFPGEIHEILYKLKEGRLIHDLEFKADNTLISGLQSAARVFAIAFLLSTLIIAAVVMNIWAGHSLLSDLLVILAASLSAGLLVGFVLKQA